jgi:hypothetical protein
MKRMLRWRGIICFSMNDGLLTLHRKNRKESELVFFIVNFEIRALHSFLPGLDISAK